ncbi:ChbG/HpnK family deacetylase [Paramagnetospirillum magnetotacticum]|nr:ChbG/HpnK family deacetylase [Paramagnetospirillum magnetotacticum]
MPKIKSAITLCADDYGLTPGLGVAIRALIGQGRLQATGCMTGSAFWPDEAKLLQSLEGRAQFGVHLTLTDQRPLGPMPNLAPEGRLPPIGGMVRRSLLRRLDKSEIAAELERQVDSFETHMGRAPDFLDGHHHVHQLPIIRDVVVDLWRRRLKPQGGWVRSCWENPFAIARRGIDPIRATIIALLGIGLRHRMRAEGIPHNLSFRGVYDFSGKVPYRELFRRFTDSPGPKTLIMCHPGQVDDALRACERLTDQREVEWRFLESDACPLSLADRGITLTGP